MSTTTQYKIGDIVQLPSVRPSRWNNGGMMDVHLGTEVIITDINGEEFKFEGSGKWSFLLEEIAGFGTSEPIAEQKEITGYKLLKVYPGSPKSGRLYKAENGIFSTAPSGTGGVRVHQPEKYPDVWEPTYEEELKAGDWAILIDRSPTESESPTWKYAFKVERVTPLSDLGNRYLYNSAGNNDYLHKFRKATYKEIWEAKAADRINISGYEATFKSQKGGDVVLFGCQPFTKPEIEFLIRIIGSSDIRAKITTMHREEITLEMLRKLLKMFNNVK